MHIADDEIPLTAMFKTNPYLEGAIMTGTARPALWGITRVSKESIFSDLNNLQVITTTSEKYTDCFGFTEEEGFAALDECGLSSKKQEVKYGMMDLPLANIRQVNLSKHIPPFFCICCKKRIQGEHLEGVYRRAGGGHSQLHYRPQCDGKADGEKVWDQ